MKIDGRTRTDLLWLAIALSALATATLVYFLDRSAGQVVFIPDALNRFATPVGLFGDLGYSLPSFAHVFSMILITGAVLSSRGSECVVVCLGWLFVEVMFELGQWSSVDHQVADFFADWLPSGPVLEVLRAYFVNGTFDGHDLVASAVGVISAYTVMRFSQRTSRQGG